MGLKRPTGLPLDPADRRVLGIALVAALAFVLGCIVVGAGLGAGLLAFRILSGGI